MSTTHNKVAMSPDDLPRQRLFRLMDLPNPPEGFEVLSGQALRGLGPEDPKDSASLIVQAEWAWSPMHNRLSNWEIGLDGTGQYWLLWCASHTDDVELADWCDEDDDDDDKQWVAVWCSQLVAACAKGDLPIDHASMLLLLHAWKEEQLEMDLDPPHFYGATGVLGIDAVRSIEQVVWAE